MHFDTARTPAWERLGTTAKPLSQTFGEQHNFSVEMRNVRSLSYAQAHALSGNTSTHFCNMRNLFLPFSSMIDDCLFWLMKMLSSAAKVNFTSPAWLLFTKHFQSCTQFAARAHHLAPLSSCAACVDICMICFVYMGRHVVQDVELLLQQAGSGI